MFEALQARTDADLAEYWKYLKHLRTDLDKNLDLGLYNLMIKDYKAYEIDGVTVGVGSIKVPLSLLYDHFGKDEMARVSQRLVEERGLDYVMAVTSYTQDDTRSQ